MLYSLLVKFLFGQVPVCPATFVTSTEIVQLLGESRARRNGAAVTMIVLVPAFAKPVTLCTKLGIRRRSDHEVPEAACL